MYLCLQISVFDLKQDRWMHIVAVGYRAEEPNSLSVLFPPAFETQPEIQSGLHRKQFFPGDVYLKGMKPCALTANTQNWIYCFKMLSCTCTHPYCMCICWIFFIICWYSLIWGWWICIYVSSFSTNRYVEENVFILAIKMIVNNAFNKQLMQ